MVTEFGAEANRDGPVEEKGTLRLPAGLRQLPPRRLRRRRPWLSGAVYWALNEFQVRPGWDGGNPRPTPPPLHQKGLLRYGDLSRKPAWEDLRRSYTAVKQVG